jgi:cell division protein FtsI/penicillin-binding protein 2
MTRTRGSGAHAGSHRAPRAGPPADAAPARDWFVPDPAVPDSAVPGPAMPDAGLPGPISPDASLPDPVPRPMGRIWVAEPAASGLAEAARTALALAGDGAQLAGRVTLRCARYLRARPRVAVALGATLVLCIGLIVGWGSPQPPAEQTVQAFLLDWENGQYRAAASLTTGNQKVVAAELARAYRQLDAADLVLGMAALSQHAGVANARFNASVNLGQGGMPWNYQGAFTLRRVGDGWKVVWSPGVIVPGLRAGQRLAVVTTLPRRAQLLDAGGQPLALLSPAYVAGVRPGALKHPGATALALARATGLPASQLLGQIHAAPSATFLTLVHLRPASYRRLSRKLRRVPGLILHRTRTRLFDSVAPVISGSVGTETARVLRKAGVRYRPGTTVGESGLQQAFQTVLAGTPTTRIVVENAAGHVTQVLKRWPGHRGSPVVTTINSATQRAADRALSSLAESAAIVAIRPGGGQILAVAQHKARGMPAVSPLAGHYRPGQAFTIVSTAALLGVGFSTSTPTPCRAANTVGGATFSNHPPEPNLGTQPLFSTDFAHACGTAFTSASLNLNAKQLTTAASRGFGIGARWQLPLPYFSGSIQSPANYAQLAADSIGTGSVRVSPLAMALAAGVTRSGSWHSPSLVTRPAVQGLPPSVLFKGEIFSQLRTLMRAAVRVGAGKPANVARSAVYGQVGSVPFGRGKHALHASWFVGFRGGVAFAVLVFTKSPGVVAAHVAGRFVRALKSGP